MPCGIVHDELAKESYLAHLRIHLGILPVVHRLDLFFVFHRQKEFSQYEIKLHNSAGFIQ
jgi:hypothetical protein